MRADCSPLPLTIADTSWAGLTRDRLVARSIVDTSSATEPLVKRADARAKGGDRDGVCFLYSCCAARCAPSLSGWTPCPLTARNRLVAAA